MSSACGTSEGLEKLNVTSPALTEISVGSNSSAPLSGAETSTDSPPPEEEPPSYAGVDSAVGAGVPAVSASSSSPPQPAKMAPARARTISMRRTCVLLSVEVPRQHVLITADDPDPLVFPDPRRRGEHHVRLPLRVGPEGSRTRAPAGPLAQHLVDRLPPGWQPLDPEMDPGAAVVRLEVGARRHPVLAGHGQVVGGRAAAAVVVDHRDRKRR